MDWSNMLLSAIGGGGITTIIVAILNKIRNNGEKMKDGDSHLKQLSEIMSGTIKDVQDIYQETIKDLRSEREHLGSLLESSHQREDKVIAMLEQSRKYNDVLEIKNRNKNKIIHAARKCELLIGHSEEDCVVLQKYEKYSDCKSDCKLNSKCDENK